MVARCLSPPKQKIFWKLKLKHLQKLQSNSVDSSRSCLDELTEEEIMEVISDDSVLPGFRPFEDKTTREARKVKRKFSSAPQMKENSFVFVTVLFHVVFYIFFALICYHHVYMDKN